MVGAAWYRNIHGLQRRGVMIRSLADNEQSWAKYLDIAVYIPALVPFISLIARKTLGVCELVGLVRRRPKSHQTSVRPDMRYSSFLDETNR